MTYEENNTSYHDKSVKINVTVVNSRYMKSCQVTQFYLSGEFILFKLLLFFIFFFCCKGVCYFDLGHTQPPSNALANTQNTIANTYGNHPEHCTNHIAMP